jgi:hypothetical protein
MGPGGLPTRSSVSTSTGGSAIVRVRRAVEEAGVAEGRVVMLELGRAGGMSARASLNSIGGARVGSLHNPGTFG